MKTNNIGHVAVKEAVFPSQIPSVDTILGPEMRSTGEAMGLDRDHAIAFAKSQLGAGVTVPTSGTLFVLGPGRRQTAHRRTGEALAEPRF